MTDHYAVIGNPISHSKSPLIHSLFAKQTNQDISYEAIESPLDGFTATIARLRDEGYKGCNITVPFKFEAFLLANQPSDRAGAPRAANTLKFDSDNILADNTDGIGLVTDISNNLHFNIKGKRVLLLGAGGAAMGVLLPLLNQKPARLVLSNRTIAKADEAAHILRTRFGEHIDGSTEFVAKGFNELAGEAFDLIINATSAGLTDSEVPLPQGIFSANALAYDMMYGRETPFMAFARREGAQIADGLGMLVEQAAEAFYIWRGVRPETAAVIAALQ